MKHVRPPPENARLPGWHWLCAPHGFKSPWHWHPTYEQWRHVNQQMSARGAAERGWSYWAPLSDAPDKPEQPAPLLAFAATKPEDNAPFR